MRIKICVLFLIVCGLWPLSSVFARTWTDTSGKYSVEAELVRADGVTVVLKKTDGTVIELSLEKLSEADRQFVRAQTAPKSPPPGPESEFQKIVAAVKARAEKPTGFLTYVPPSPSGASFVSDKWIREENEFKVEKVSVTKSATKAGAYEGVIVVTRKIIVYVDPKNDDRGVSGNMADRWFDSEAEAMQAAKSIVEDDPTTKEADKLLFTIYYQWKNNRWVPAEESPMRYYPFSEQRFELGGYKQISRNTYGLPLLDGPKSREPQYVDIKKVYDVAKNGGGTPTSKAGTSPLPR